jgi:DNA-binding NtrC family response regulator
LRDRRDDIPALALGMIQAINRKHGCEITGIHHGALEKMAAHSWPGNVRELRNVMEWAALTTRKGSITARQLPANLRAPHSERAEANHEPSGPPVGRTLKELEREYIIETLKATGNNRSETARTLGISLRTLYNRLSVLSISTDSKKTKSSAGAQ